MHDLDSLEGVVIVGDFSSHCARCRANYTGNNTCDGCGQQLAYAKASQYMRYSPRQDELLRSFAEDNRLEALL